jgi:hypothetical protein
VGGGKPADWGVSVQGRRPERLCLHLYQRRQPRTLDPPAKGHGPRGPARRRALRHTGRAHETQGRGGPNCLGIQYAMTSTPPWTWWAMRRSPARGIRQTMKQPANERLRHERLAGSLRQPPIVRNHGGAGKFGGTSTGVADHMRRPRPDPRISRGQVERPCASGWQSAVPEAGQLALGAEAAGIAVVGIQNLGKHIGHHHLLVDIWSRRSRTTKLLSESKTEDCQHGLDRTWPAEAVRNGQPLCLTTAQYPSRSGDRQRRESDPNADTEQGSLVRASVNWKGHTLFSKFSVEYPPLNTRLRLKYPPHMYITRRRAQARQRVPRI